MNSVPILRSANSQDMARVRELIERIMRELELPEPAIQALDDLDDVDRNYYRRDGIFELLIDEDDRIIGCIGLRRLDADTAELRRMYVEAGWRGWGLGRLLLAHTLGRAADLGYRRLELSTARCMTRAIGLYEATGFERLDVEGGNPDTACEVRFALELDRARGMGVAL